MDLEFHRDSGDNANSKTAVPATIAKQLTNVVSQFKNLIIEIYGPDGPKNWGEDIGKRFCLMNVEYLFKEIPGYMKETKMPYWYSVTEWHSKLEKVALEVGTHFNQINSEAYEDHLSLSKNTEKDFYFDSYNAMKEHELIGGGFEKPVLLDVFDCYSILHQLSVFTFFDAGLIHQRFNGLPRFTNSRDDRYNHAVPSSDPWIENKPSLAVQTKLLKYDITHIFR